MRQHVPIGGRLYELRFESGPIEDGRKRRPSYVDHAHRVIRVNGLLPASERLWAACCAVALAADQAHASSLLVPLVTAVAD
jgi:hypothetical protein